MTDLIIEAEHLAALTVWAAAFLALAMVALVVLERTLVAVGGLHRSRLDRRYEPLVRRALGGDDTAVSELAASPFRHRVILAWMLIGPLIDDRDQARIDRTRTIVREISLLKVADRFLASRKWWRRALALRALGLLQARSHTGAIVAALDDAHIEVRAAALAALADLRDPASLPALVVRLHDESLHRGRHAAALAAFGSGCEDFLLEMAEIDARQRVSYARALAICGTERSLPLLRGWAKDPRVDVRAAAFEALGHVGLDEPAAGVAIDALTSDDERVRAMAAFALRGWTGQRDAVPHLARRLDDAWPVAVQAARSLRAIPGAGIAALQASSSQPDTAGMLARQMLWEIGGR